MTCDVVSSLLEPHSRLASPMKILPTRICWYDEAEAMRNQPRAKGRVQSWIVLRRPKRFMTRPATSVPTAMEMTMLLAVDTRHGRKAGF